jgi:hypothetical protein
VVRVVGGRNTKGMAVGRYLTGCTGIPMLSWDLSTARITAPPPYAIDVTTSRKLQNWYDLIRADTDAHTVHAVVRYDMSFDSVEQAWVGMNMRTFSKLLTAHYESIRPRINSYVEGE